MPNIHGRNSLLHVFDNAGTSRNISGDLNSYSLAWTRDNPATTTFGKDSVQRISGIRDATMSIAGIWNTETASGNDVVMNGLLGGSANALIRFMPAGCTTGCVFYTGCFLVSQYQMQAALTGAVAWTGTMQLSSGSISASSV